MKLPLLLFGLLLLALPRPAAARGDAPAQPRGTLSGRVLDREGKPLAGAEVTIFPSTERSGDDRKRNLWAALTFAGQEDRATARLRSGTDGSFVARDLPTGAYTVRATRPDRLRTMEEARVGGPFERPLTLVLLEGPEVTGRVVDEEGKGVGGARVALTSVGDGASAYDRDHATCDAEGRFRAVVETVFVYAFADGYVEAVAETSIHAPDDVTIVLPRGGQLEVTVVDRETGAPIVGAEVLFGGGAARLGATDARGGILFSAPPGPVRMLSVEHAHYAEKLYTGLSRLRRAGSPDAVEGLDRPVERGRTTSIRVRLAKGLTLVGRVLSIDGAPISGANVSTGIDFERTDRIGVSVASGGDGSYTWSGLLEGDIAGMEVEAAGWVRAREVEGKPVRSGSTVSMDLRMRPAPIVRGRVLDAQGRPVIGAAVRLVGPRSGDTAPVPTDEAGEFTLTIGGRPADPRFRAEPPPQPPAETKVLVQGDLMEATSAPFKLPTSGILRVPDVVIRQANLVAGRVVDPEGRPAASAHLEAFVAGTVRDSWNSHWKWTPASGAFEFTNLPTGKIVLTAHLDGFAPVKRTVMLVAGTPLWDVELRLRPARIVRGIVLDPKGRPLDEADVRRDGPLQGVEGDAAYAGDYHTGTGADGTFEFQDVPTGKVKVHVTAPGMRAASAWVESGGAPHEFRLVAVATDPSARKIEIAAEVAAIEEEIRVADERRRIDDHRKRIEALRAEEARLR